MPRLQPTSKAIDERPCLRLQVLKQQGYLTPPGRLQPITYQLSPTGSVSLHIQFEEEEEPTSGWLRLSYTHSSGLIHQVISLSCQPSNLGRGGGVWYAICPHTGRRCRVLFMGSRYFGSRWAIEGGLYQSQRISKSERGFISYRRKLRQLEELMSLTHTWLCKPHSKRSYGGKLTRPMQRYLKLKAAAERSKP